MTELHAALKLHFGFQEFRAGQESVVRDALDGRDLLALMPTGGGKSLCFQLPALLMPGVTFVVSPLIALMHDQVRQLQDNGIAASYLNSSLEHDEISARLAKLLAGRYKLLYVAPERILLRDFLEGPLRRLNESFGINAFVIDEAHCVSEWGHDFRRDYRQLSQLRRCFPAVPILAFTATATPRVQKDILGQLALRDPAIHLSSFNRPNLFYKVEAKDKHSYAALLAQARAGGAGIVYCLSRRRADETAELLQQDGIRALPYHAGLDASTRTNSQEAFIRDDVQVIVATVAFGMGINKPDVRWVAHYDLPKTLEGYYQESGRAGRDGDPALCTLYFGASDIRTAEFLIQQKIDPVTGEPLEAEQRLARQQLRQILNYAQASDCRRAIQLRYFGEPFAGACGACDNCCDTRRLADRSVEARQFISCVARLAQRGQRFGAAHIIDILRGAKCARVLGNGHETLSTYGIGKRHSVQVWRALARALLHQGLLDETQDGYPVLSLNDASREVLREERTVHVAIATPGAASATAPVAAPGSSANRAAPARDAAATMFETLRALRKRLADEHQLPPYVVFHDSTLREMAQRRPRTLHEFSMLPGVGQAKLARYGEEFLAALLESVHS